MRGSVPWLVIALIPATLQPLAGQGTARDLRKLDVCQLIPGTAIAAAFRGTLSKATPFNDTRGSFARCTYIVTPSGAPAGATEGYAVWVYPPSDFDELRKYTSAPLKPESGIGDAAYSFLDKDDGRAKLRVLLRGDVALEVTSDSVESARTVAGVAVRALRPGR